MHDVERSSHVFLRTQRCGRPGLRSAEPWVAGVSECAGPGCDGGDRDDSLVVVKEAAVASVGEPFVVCVRKEVRLGYGED